MVKTNIQTFTGEVEILSNLHLGDGSYYLTANADASNVVEVTGNVGATFFVGDGGFLSNIATTLSDIVDQGNSVSNVVQFSSDAGVSDYKGVGLVTNSNVGIQNTSPDHTLSIADIVVFDKEVSEPSASMNVYGKVYATRFEGDGGLLSNIATTLQSIVDQGNVSANVVQFNSATGYAGAGIITRSNVGIQNTAPVFNLSVGSNLHVDDEGSNVLVVDGNVAASNLNLGAFTVSPSHDLDQVCAEGNTVTRPVRFSNVITGISAASNIESAGTFISTDAERGIDVASNIDIGGRLKFDSNVFIDTLRVADVASNIVTYDRATGELTDSSGTFMNKFAVVSEQPPSDFFANTTTVTNHGAYTLTTSNLATDSNTYNAFDGTANAWVSGGLAGGYIDGSNVFETDNLTQLSNLHPTQFGDWLAIEFPYKTTLRHMKLTPLSAAQFPASANLYATNNDITWSEIKYWEDVVPASDTAVQTITVDATEQFKKYALVVTKAAGNSSNVAIQDWQLFTESFSIDGGKVAMAQQATTGGETVMDQSGPHSRLPKTVPLKKYPEIAFEKEKFSFDDSANTYIQAGYTISASTSESENRAPWKVFNNTFTEGNGWRGTGTYSSTDGSFTGTFVDFTNGGQSIATADQGEWLKITLPEKIKLDHFRLQPRNSPTDGGHPISYGRSEFVKDGAIWGSNDGSSWSKLYTINATIPATESSHEIFTVPNSAIAYNNFVLVVTKTQGAQYGAGANGVLSSFSEWELYGYEEDPPLGDTSIDTTFTSTMNTPQTTRANVYVDGDLGSTFTNRVPGLLDSNITNAHTTYVSAGKYWELVGNVESNVTIEANTFLSGDAPHSFSMWFNSSNLEANVSNSCIFSLNSSDERFDHKGVAISNTYQTMQKLFASDGAADDRFGQGDGVNGVSMSDDGSIAVVGAFYDNTRTGAAYIFVKDANGHWNEVQKLTASDAAQEDRFGCSTDISSDGTYIVVGSYLAHSTDGNNTADIGAAYVFKRTTGTNSWTQQQILNSSHASSTDQFGRRVSISGDGTYIVCNEQNADQTTTNQGAAYVFKRSGETWGTPTVLEASDGATADFFGTSVDISSDGNYIAIGAMHDDGVGTDDDGSVYIFNRTGDNTWSQQQKIDNPDVSGIDNYFGGENNGVSLSSDGTYLIVGAYGRASNGAVFFFKRTGTSWAILAGSGLGGASSGTYTEPNGATGNLFGRAVTMSKDGLTALVHSRDNTQVTSGGAVFVYTRSGDTWTYKYKITHPDRTASDHFGSSLAISSDGSYFIAGMFNDDDLGSSAGAVYIYTRDTKHTLDTKFDLKSNTWHNLTYAYQGESGSRVTYLDGYKVAEDQAENTYGAYPPFPMTGYSQGGYTVSSSWESGTAEIKSYNAFNAVGVTHRWQVSSGYSTSAPYLAVDNGGPYGLPQITDTNGTIHTGHWLKLELPHKIYLNRFKTTEYNHAQYQLGSYVILGSNDDVNWTLVHTETVANLGGGHANGTHDAAISVTQAFKYFILLIKAKTASGSTSSHLLVQQVIYYGHRENDMILLPDTQVLKYPRKAMNPDHTVGYNKYINRFEEVSTTSEYSTNGGTYSLVKAFDNIDGVNLIYWSAGKKNSVSGNLGRYAAGSHGAYNEANGDPPTGKSFIPSNATTAQKGEWIKMKSYRKLKLNKIELLALSTTHKLVPSGVLIWGSDNDSDWTLLKTHVPGGTGGAVTYSSRLGVITVNSTVAYKYHAMVMTHMNNSDTGYTLMSISQIKFFGAEEATSIPIQIGGGNIDKLANFRVYDKFIEEDQALEIWDAQKDQFDRVKSSMTLHKGRLGIGTTEPDGRLAVVDEPTSTFEPRWPPKPLIGYRTHIEGYGEFVVHRSPNESGGEYRGDSWWIFDDRQNTHNYTYHGERVAGTNDSYFGGANGLYDGSKSLGGFAGDWTVLESPIPIKINDIIRMRVRGSGQSTKGFIIVAANDLSGPWTKVTEQTDIIWKYGALGESKTFHFENDTYYKYYGIIITHALQVNGYPTLSNMEFSGTIQRESQSVFHDGQLTLTKNLDVSRIGPALDVDNTPRRDRLIAEFNTSTNPTFEGAVRDTSGRGNDGTLQGGAYYNANDKAITFDGAGDYIRMCDWNYGTGFVHSFSGWVKIKKPEESWTVVYGVGDASGADRKNFTIWALTNSNKFRSEADGTGGYIDHTFEFTGKLDRWMHVAVVKSGASIISTRMYINGEILPQGSGSNQNEDIVMPNSPQNFNVGSYAPSPGSEINADYSNIKFYDVALTAEEVKTLYDMGRCDEGHHMVNFSKTRVGIGLGDGETARSTLDVRERGILSKAYIGEPYNGDDVSSRTADLVIKQSGDVNDDAKISGIRMFRAANDTNSWHFGVSSSTCLEFFYNNATMGYLGRTNQGLLDFTGQHRTFIKDIPFSRAGELEGLVVSSDQNKYVKLSGGIEAGSNAITINESIPIVSLSNVVTDKTCFGVISASEDPEERSDSFGNFVSVSEKEKGDTRVYINSVGEGAIWVVNTNGSLEAGDYITTSNVAGYGQKQDDDILHNYSVAKITMDCDFEPATQPIQQILRSNVVETYYLGNVHYTKTVPHEIITTTVGANDNWSNVYITPSDVTYAEWSNLEANIQNTYTLTYTQSSNVVYDTKYTLTTTANVTESDSWDRVSIDPPGVTYADWSNLEAHIQNTYTLTFTQTTTDEKTPEEWSVLESNTQSFYNKVYYQSVEEEVAPDYPGAVAHTRVTDRIENELDAHGQIQWENHPTETEKAYKLRYLTADGTQTDEANAVHIAAFVGCTYHCG